MKVFNEITAPDTTGTSLKGYIYLTYNQLVEVLGEPTFNKESGDGKTQVGWVVEYEGKVFTIYDWKIYDRDYTLNGLGKFNVGGKSYAIDFTEYLESRF